MRTAFLQALMEEAQRRPEIFLVVGDLGFSVVEPFAEAFPERFLNAGVAEQNLTGVAAGLASEGYHVWTYSIANFPTLRCLEQLRNDVCQHELPVTVVAVGGGVAYGNLGYSHHAVQDLAVIRSLGAMTVLSPADPGETQEAVGWLAAHPRPSYLRLGKAGEAPLHEVRGVASGLLEVRPGEGSTALVATGSVLQVALAAADSWTAHTPPPAVYSCPWLWPPLPRQFAALHRYQRVCVVEEHVAVGGLGEFVRQQLPRSIEVVALDLPVSVSGWVGSQAHLREKAGLTVAEIRRVLAE